MIFFTDNFTQYNIFNFQISGLTLACGEEDLALKYLATIQALAVRCTPYCNSSYLSKFNLPGSTQCPFGLCCYIHIFLVCMCILPQIMYSCISPHKCSPFNANWFKLFLNQKTYCTVYYLIQDYIIGMKYKRHYNSINRVFYFTLNYEHTNYQS